MPKARRDQSSKSTTPYTRTRANDKKRKPSNPTTSTKKSKNAVKSKKIKDAELTEHLDDLIQDLQPKAKVKLTKDRASSKSLQLEAAQREYEKTQNDMEDALSLLTRL